MELLTEKILILKEYIEMNNHGLLVPILIRHVKKKLRLHRLPNPETKKNHQGSKPGGFCIWPDTVFPDS